jgi:hypothetical protein
MAEQTAMTRPSRPTIDAVTDNVPPHTGVIDRGGLTNDPSPTMSGRGDVGSIIHILVDGREVGTAVVKPNGTWSFSLPQALSDGEYRLTARASNDAGWSVPSTSYGIQVDVTPPSQPKIEAATEGTSPMLSGRAEAYSTVTVYDGTTLLGTTTTNIDGTWAFQLPSGLSNGTHALTVSAMDPAGNTSVRSEGFDVTVGPVAPPVPTTKAMLDDMGRDSGNFNFDRLTNDGTAGRLLSGHLTAALAAGEKVQVSTDGGRTWVDAVMKTDGTWVAIDPNVHAGNWTIQTRVVNGDGVAGESNAYDVMLDAAATSAPDSLTFDTATGSVQIGIAKSGAISNDTLKLILGNYTFDHKLTAQEIASGNVTISIPVDIQAALGSSWHAGMKMYAVIIDQAGNSSDWRWSNKESSKWLDLAGQNTGSFQKLTVDGVTIESIYNPEIFNQWVGIRASNGTGDHGTLSCFGLMKISLDGYTATSVSMRVGGPQQGWGHGTAQIVAQGTLIHFFDAKGERITTYGVPYSQSGSVDVTYTMPNGKAFSSMVVATGYYSLLEYVGEIEGGTQWQYVPRPHDRIQNALSEIKYNFGSDAWKTGVEPVHEIQDVVVLSGFYTGGQGDDVFNVADVGYFDGAGVGVHGGAGTDTLKLTGSGQTLDLSKLLNVVGHDKITSIEIIDITGVGNNTLKLSMRDVLELGHENVFRNDGHTQLMVNGNAGDRVELSGMSGLALGNGQWMNKGLIAVNGQAYTLYENAALHVELLVQSSISTQLV